MAWIKVRTLPMTPVYPTYYMDDSIWMDTNNNAMLLTHSSLENKWIIFNRGAYLYKLIVPEWPAGYYAQCYFNPTMYCWNDQEVYIGSSSSCGVNFLWYDTTNGWVMNTGPTVGPNHFMKEGYDPYEAMDDGMGGHTHGVWLGHSWFSGADKIGEFIPRGYRKDTRTSVHTEIYYNPDQWLSDTLLGIYTHRGGSASTYKVGYIRMQDNHGGYYVEKATAEGTFGLIDPQQTNIPSLYAIGGTVYRGSQITNGQVGMVFIGSNYTCQILVTAVYPETSDPTRGAIRTFNIVTPGSGYAVGNVVTFSSGLSAAKFVVTSINLSGGITGLTIYSPTGCWEAYGTLPTLSGMTALTFNRVWSSSTTDPTPYNLTVSFKDYVEEGYDKLDTFVTQAAFWLYDQEE